MLNTFISIQSMNLKAINKAIQQNLHHLHHKFLHMPCDTNHYTSRT